MPYVMVSAGVCYGKSKCHILYGEFASMLCRFLEVSPFRKTTPPHTPHNSHSSGLPLIIPSSSIRMNGPKIHRLKSLRLPCLECCASSLPEVPATPTNVSELKVALQRSGMTYYSIPLIDPFGVSRSD